jgi:hypothetical protein
MLDLDAFDGAVQVARDSLDAIQRSWMLDDGSTAS